MRASAMTKEDSAAPVFGNVPRGQVPFQHRSTRLTGCLGLVRLELMNRQRLFPSTLPLVVVLVLTLVPAASAGLPNPCQLLTNTEVASVLGGQVVSRSGDAHRGVRAWPRPVVGPFSCAGPHV